MKLRFSSRVRDTLALTIGAIVISLATQQSPAFAIGAVHPNNRPTAIPGVENGNLDATRIIKVTADCAVAREAAPSLFLLLRSAKYQGVTVRTRDCYRPLADQIRAQRSWASAGNSACAASPSYYPDGRPKGTSMHGWGKAVDLNYGGAMWNSAGYRYLKAEAWRYGWNHPGWAEPGGSACPEAWHWEWVGDGGTMAGDPVIADKISLLPSAGGDGYAIVNGLGGVSTYGDAQSYGSANDIPLNWVMVGAAASHDRRGYWMVGADGGIFSFGDAGFYGSMGSARLNQAVIGMAPTPSGNGYWLVAADGGVFSFGDAQFHGSTGSMRLNRPIVGMISSPTGNGYWLVASDGGIFAFGDAAFYGSMGGERLNKPIIGAVSAPGGNGYWMVASDGGVFTFGNIGFHGSLGSAPPEQPVVGVTPTSSGNGYWMLNAKGDVFAFGDAKNQPRAN